MRLLKAGTLEAAYLLPQCFHKVYHLGACYCVEQCILQLVDSCENIKGTISDAGI